jgi:TRAP-type C4-dicarboxylate transport system permease small subunit
VTRKPLPDWIRGGAWLAAAFIAALLLVKPIGVSTQYVIADGLIWSLFDDGLVTPTDQGFTSTNAYLAKSGGKYAEAVANPWTYGFIFVLAIPFGAFLSARLMRPNSRNATETNPWLPRIAQAAGQGVAQRAVLAFGGGFLTLFGARLAGGCTSGHRMSGISQTAVSGYLFAAGVFATAVPVALWLYRRRDYPVGTTIPGGAA